MRDYSDISLLMERIIHKYVQAEKKKRTYGTKVLLTRAEIHTIAAIGDNPMINVTTLAKVLGITKGAASQMIYKLLDKGVVTKNVSPESDTEVVLGLTKDGMINYEAHREYHKNTNDELFATLRDLPEETYNQLHTALSAFEQLIDRKLESK